MIGQLIAMRMGMGIMSRRESGFCLRVMCGMGIRVSHGVMLFFPFVAFLILTGW